MKKFLFVAAIVLSAVNVSAKSNVYKVEPTNGTISFTITKWSVIKEEGTFRKFAGNITFDPERPAEASVEFKVDSSSVDTKNANRDTTVRSDNFLDVAKHPYLTFRSTKVIPRGNNAFNVIGDLTIKGVTRRITIPVRLLGMTSQKGVGDIASFETRFTIDRRQWGVTGGRWVASSPGVLANEVTIEIVAGGISR
jgi:polyisoprenoid-binding protein YceI